MNEDILIRTLVMIYAIWREDRIENPPKQNELCYKQNGEWNSGLIHDYWKKFKLYGAYPYACSGPVHVHQSSELGAKLNLMKPRGTLKSKSSYEITGLGVALARYLDTKHIIRAHAMAETYEDINVENWLQIGEYVTRFFNSNVDENGYVKGPLDDDYWNVFDGKNWNADECYNAIVSIELTADDIWVRH